MLYLPIIIWMHTINFSSSSSIVQKTGDMILTPQKIRTNGVTKSAVE